MSRSSSGVYWLLWIVASLSSAAALAYVLFEARDKSLFMPGPLSAGHHQLEEACDVCHRAAFGGAEVLQEACIDCHGDARVKPFDSHPRSKFTDPRNADQLQEINALQCVSCHTEHRPEITGKDGLTQPRDLCFHCHAAIAEERPSHQGMSFDSCASAGCHNFHDNRALYTDFLVKHMDAAALAGSPRLPAREFAGILDEIVDYPRELYPPEALGIERMDAPADRIAPGIADDWAATAHARSGVNCSACHQPRDGSGTEWQDSPAVAVCENCHTAEVLRFTKGKHGMRIGAGLSAMQPASARLPMQEQAAHSELDCNSCHSGHRFDVAYAAVEACLGCHADQHSLAYEGSPHHQLWLAEQSGAAASGSGVSCASCHMPRIDYDVSDWLSRKMVDHNQSATLSPNTKMIRPACLHCHGLGFSIDALADPTLIDNNFAGQPSSHVQSIDLARADQQRYLRERERSAQ